MNRRRLAVPAIWVCCVAVACVIVARARYVTDLSAFLPAKPTPTQQLLVDQLRDGPASRLILIALEQGDAVARAQVSAAMASRLRRDAQFSSVNNGEPVTAERDREFLFRHRYLLSDTVTAERFAPPGLHAAGFVTVPRVRGVPLHIRGQNEVQVGRRWSRRSKSD